MLKSPDQLIEKGTRIAAATSSVNLPLRTYELHSKINLTSCFRCLEDEVTTVVLLIMAL